MNSLSSGLIDVAIGNLHLNPKRYIAFDIAPTYAYVSFGENHESLNCNTLNLQDKLTFVVPSPREISLGSALVSVYDRKTWFCILFTLTALLIAIYALHLNYGQYKEQEHEHYQTMQGIMLGLFSVLVANNFLKAPRATYLRIIIATWMLSALVLHSLQSTNLARIAIHPQFEKHIQLDTLTDADLSLATVGYLGPYLRIFNATIKKQVRSYVCNSFVECYDRLKKQR